MSKFGQKLDNFFEISARNSTIKTELIGGLTTFFAMCYIVLVNPGTMTGQNPGGNLYNAVYIATCLGAIIGTLLMSLYAKMPFAQASGMGLNAFFFVSFMLKGIEGTIDPFSDNAFYYGLSIIFVSGLVFMFLSVTGLRKKIAEAMPDCLKKAVPAGIGLFIAFIGLLGSGLIVFKVIPGSDNTIENIDTILIQLRDFNMYDGGVRWVDAPLSGIHGISAPLAAFTGFLLIAFLSKTKLKKVNVIIGILFTTCLYYLFNAGHDLTFMNIGKNIDIAQTFKDFGKFGIQGWYQGFQFWHAATFINILMLIVTFCLVDMFDTLGTLQGTAAEAGMLDENGNPINLNKCLMADSTATVVGAMVGTSTVTTFVESSSGVSAGARTGLASLVTAFMFFIVMFLTPVAAVIPACATAPALMYVGVLMLKNIVNVDFKDLTSAVPAFLTLIVMPLSYSISNGIAAGMISYIILKLANVLFLKQEVASEVEGEEPVKRYIIKDYFAIGKGKTGEFFSKDIIILIISALFVTRFFMVTF